MDAMQWVVVGLIAGLFGLSIAGNILLYLRLGEAKQDLAESRHFAAQQLTALANLRKDVMRRGGAWARGGRVDSGHIESARQNYGAHRFPEG